MSTCRCGDPWCPANASPSTVYVRTESIALVSGLPSAYDAAREGQQ